MRIKEIVKSRLVWALGAGVLLFVILLLLFGDLSSAQFFKVMVFAAIGASAVVVAAIIADRETVTISGNTPSKVLSRVASGDLSISATEIDRTVGSGDMASAVRGLVLNLERTISRFTQLSTDVSKVSEQINQKAQNLAQVSLLQSDSAATTSNSVTEIDTSINSVQRSMENLSANAEETSTSILQMSASIEEVSRITDRRTRNRSRRSRSRPRARWSR